MLSGLPIGQLTEFSTCRSLIFSSCPNQCARCNLETKMTNKTRIESSEKPASTHIHYWILFSIVCLIFTLPWNKTFPAGRFGKTITSWWVTAARTHKDFNRVLWLQISNLPVSLEAYSLRLIGEWKRRNEKQKGNTCVGFFIRSNVESPWTPPRALSAFISLSLIWNHHLHKKQQEAER